LKNELEVAIRAAKAAGSIIREEFGKSSTITLKKDESFQTQADRLSEEKIISIIKASFPNHSICAEESGLLEKKSKQLWIIDPLDGTTNFATRIPFFSVSIALVENKRVKLGVVYDPNKDEVFTAEFGKGAKLNESIIRVSATSKLSKSMIGYSRSSQAKERFIDVFQKVEKVARTPKVLGSTALQLCYVADGRLDADISLSQEPWDIAAGSLVIKEAGGTISNIEGKEWALDISDIVASNGKIHEELLAVLKTDFYQVDN